MSNVSRTCPRTLAIRPLASLLVASLALGTVACDVEEQDELQLDELDDEAPAGDDFRGTYSRGRYGSGTLLNTGNIGTWVFEALKLDGTAHNDITLLDVQTAPFDYAGSRPFWEHDDITAYEFVQHSAGRLDLHVNNLHMLEGITNGGTFLQHGDFHDSRWTVQFDAAHIPLLDAEHVQHFNGMVELRLEVDWLHPDNNMHPPGPHEDGDEAWLVQHGSVPIYTFYYVQDLDEVSTCVSAAAPGPTYTTAVLYNDVLVDSSSGDVTFDEDILQIACLEGAVGKAGGLWGYWPDEMDDPTYMTSGDARPHFDMVTRAVRADYCGDGDSWTQTGTEVELFDAYWHTWPGSVRNDVDIFRPTVEAVWAPGGALCLENRRWIPWFFGLGPSCWIPTCNNGITSATVNAFDMLNDPWSPSTMVTRTTRVMEPNI